MRARLFTVVVGAPIVLGAAIAGGAWFTGLILAAEALAAWELRGLLQGTRYAPISLLLVLGAMVPPLATHFHSVEIAAAGIGLGVLGALPNFRPQADGRARWIGTGLSAATGLYAGLLWAPAIRVSEGSHGSAWLVTIIIATWACDVAAYLIGRQWGRTRLAPKLSPQKSIEGVAAGMVAAVLGGLGTGMVLDLPTVLTLCLGVLVGAAAVIGDLAESAFKRWVGAKDSGWIMPGHGGILDRIDSLLLSGFVGSLYVGLVQ